MIFEFCRIEFCRIICFYLEKDLGMGLYFYFWRERREVRIGWYLGSLFVGFDKGVLGFVGRRRGSG